MNDSRCTRLSYILASATLTTNNDNNDNNVDIGSSAIVAFFFLRMEYCSGWSSRSSDDIESDSSSHQCHSASSRRWIVNETVFDIELDGSLLSMHDSTRLVFVDTYAWTQGSGHWQVSKFYIFSKRGTHLIAQSSLWKVLKVSTRQDKSICWSLSSLLVTKWKIYPCLSFRTKLTIPTIFGVSNRVTALQDLRVEKQVQTTWKLARSCNGSGTNE